MSESENAKLIAMTEQQSYLRVGHTLDTREDRIRRLVPHPSDAIPESARGRIVVQGGQARPGVRLSDRHQSRTSDALPPRGKSHFERKNVQLPLRHRTEHLVGQRPSFEVELAPHDLDGISLNGEPMITAVDPRLLLPPGRGELARRGEHTPLLTLLAREDLDEGQRFRSHVPTLAAKQKGETGV